MKINKIGLQLLWSLSLWCWANLLLGQDITAPTNFTISGYIKDSRTAETIIGASVTIKELQTGVVSNSYGFYSVSLPKGNYTLIFSTFGYVTQSIPVSLEKSQKLDVSLVTEDFQLEEIQITDEIGDENIKSMEMSVNKIDMRTIQKMPALLGEVDLVRSIQLLPGVTTVGEGASGFNVRGGTIDQNLILLDEAPLYNSSHLFGFFSVFNPDAVKDVQLMKGSIPAQYGGRLSSILDVKMKEGNAKQLSGSGGIGTIFSRLTLEGPIAKEKASFIVAARRSYIDVLARPFLNKELSGSKFYFYDLTAKANWIIDSKNTVFLSGYFGRDVFGAGFKFNWGNGTGTLRWNHLFNDKLFSNTTLIYSNYDYELGFGEDDKDRFDWNSQIITNSLKQQFNYYMNPKNTFYFGGQFTYYIFKPGSAVGISQGERRDISLDKKYAFEGAIYAENEQKLSNRWGLRYGLRFSFYNYLGKGTAYTYAETQPGFRRFATESKEYKDWENIQDYNYLEPRFSVKYEIDEMSSVKASYIRTTQYLHLVSNTTAATPLDVWTPSTNNIKPQVADQFTLGYFRNFGKNNMYESSIEVYYKDFQNQLDYIDGADLLLNKYLEGDLLNAKGRAYGFEAFLKKSKGDFTGWISYTLARTERQVKGINQGKWFPNRFDRPHNLYLVAMYDLTPRLNFGANFVYASGTPATFPTNRIEMQGYIIPHNSENRRNNYRIPDYHRLDISVTLNNKKKIGRRWESSWVFSIYNVYSRRNPFSIFFKGTENDETVTKAYRFYILGYPVPGVTYNFKF